MRKKLLSMLMTATLAISMLAGCGSGTEDKATTGNGTQAVSGDVDYSKLKIGVIINTSKTDGGWNEAQINGLEETIQKLGLSDDQYEYIEGVSETGSDTQNAVESLVADGCNFILATSTGHKTDMEALAQKYPDLLFAEADGNTVGDNLIGYAIQGIEGMFLMGYMCAKLSPTDELGYVAGMPESSVIEAIDGFALGAKYANENATVRPLFANSWYDPEVEGQCANSLISLGISYIGIGCSSPAAAQACADAGVYCTGYNLDTSSYAPTAVLSSFMWNWEPIFEDILTSYVENNYVPAAKDYLWGAQEGCISIAPFADDLVPEDVQKDVLDVQDKIQSGEINVLAGEIKDNEGNIIVEEGSVMDEESSRKYDYFVDNVDGQLP